MADHARPSSPSRLVENNNVKLTHNWGQPPRNPPEYEDMQSALKRRKALSIFNYLPFLVAAVRGDSFFCVPCSTGGAAVEVVNNSLFEFVVTDCKF